MTKIVETSLDDHSRSRYTSLVHKHYSIAQLIFIIATLSSFILKKLYKYFSTTHSITEEIRNDFPKSIPPSTDSSIAPPTAIVPPIPSSYVLQTVNHSVCKNSLSCPMTNF